MSYTFPAPNPRARAPRLKARAFVAGVVVTLVCLCATGAARGQGFERDLDASAGVELRIKNRTGRVTITASEEGRKQVSIRATSGGSPVTEKDVRVGQGAGGVTIEVEREHAQGGGGAGSEGKFSGSLVRLERERIDLTLSVPPRARVRVETEGGAVDVVGNVSSAEVRTGTGTIRADVPLDALRYSFRWTLSRPRFFSEVELPEVKSRRGGVYEISGRFGEKKAKSDERIELRLETERGVVLFGVKDEAAVPSDLRPRELTEAARAIIRSGDSEMTDAIRKIAPRLVGEYAATLPPHRSEPTLGARTDPFEVKTSAGQSLARVQARVTDRNGRALPGLSARDFSVVEDGVERAVREVTPSTAPFDLVLLLDVSGSVEERLDFIRKAALNFAEAAGAEDRIAIISFRDDVQLVSDFTADRGLLAKRIKDIQAGGATALYDAIGYTLVHTLRPVRGGRTGVVILSDGDDNRSFVTFPSILEAVIESGAVVYPLYVPSGLIPSGSAPVPTTTLDPMRSRYLTLTSRAGEEGSRLAEISGGTYYPITRLEQLQKAYDDVIAQLRTSYTVTFESDAATARRNSRVRVRVARPDVTVRLSPAVGVAATSAAP